MSGEAARTARLELERLLAAEAPALARRLPMGLFDLLERYVTLLLEANRRLNLTRITEPQDMARLHLLDALAALPLVDELAPTRALDLGSGGGVPGIVLASARRDVAWTLVDAERRKAEALESFVDALGLTNVLVVAERAETLGHDPGYRASFDLVTARACAALPVLVEYAIPLIGETGALLAWKAAVEKNELEGGSSAAREVGGTDPELRGTGVSALGGRRFVVIRRRTPTPERFPRRPGVPSRRPLG